MRMTGKARKGLELLVPAEFSLQVVEIIHQELDFQKRRAIS